MIFNIVADILFCLENGFPAINSWILFFVIPIIISMCQLAIIVAKTSPPSII